MAGCATSPPCLTTAGSAPVLPETVFRAAGLEMAGFTETAPEHLPTIRSTSGTPGRGRTRKSPDRVIGGDRLLEGADHPRYREHSSTEDSAPHPSRQLPQLEKRDRMDHAGRGCVFRRAAGAPELEAAKDRHTRRVACGGGSLRARGNRLGRNGPSLDQRGLLRRRRRRRRRLARVGGHPVPGLPGARTGGARALAALHRHLEPRARRTLARPPSRPPMSSLAPPSAPACSPSSSWSSR